MTQRGIDRHTVLLLALTLGAQLLVFGQTPSLGFITDDRSLLVTNARLLEPGAAVRAFAEDYWDVSDSAVSGYGYYRPLVKVIHVLAWRISQKPALLHVVNLAVHLLNVVLAWLWLRARIPSASVAIVAPTLLALSLHPARVEAIAWLSGLPDLLMCTFMLLGLWAYETNRTALTVVSFSLGLLTKEPALIFPFMCLFDALVRRDALKRRSAIISGVVVGGIFAVRLGFIPIQHSTASSSLGLVSAALTSLGYHVSRAVWPFPPSYSSGAILFGEHGEPLIPTEAWLAPLLLIAGLAWSLRRAAAATERAERLGEFVFVIAPVVLPILASARELNTLGAERYLYASLFVCSALFARTTLPNRLVQLLSVTAALFFGLAAFQHVTSFKNDDTLALSELEKNPQLPKVQLEALTALIRVGANREAATLALDVVQHAGAPLQRTRAAAILAGLSISQNSEQDLPNALRLLRLLYEGADDVGEFEWRGERYSLTQLGRARAFLGRVDMFSDAQYFYAKALMQSGDAREALRVLKARKAAYPAWPVAWLDVARALAWNLRFRQALAAYNETVSAFPTAADESLVSALQHGASAHQRRDTMGVVLALVRLDAVVPARAFLDSAEVRSAMPLETWRQARAQLERTIGRPDLAAPFERAPAPLSTAPQP